MYILALPKIDVEHLFAHSVTRCVVKGGHNKLWGNSPVFANWTFDLHPCFIRHFLHRSQQILLPALSTEFVSMAGSIQSLPIERHQTYLTDRFTTRVQSHFRQCFCLRFTHQFRQVKIIRSDGETFTLIVMVGSACLNITLLLCQLQLLLE